MISRRSALLGAVGVAVGRKPIRAAPKWISFEARFRIVSIVETGPQEGKRPFTVKCAVGPLKRLQPGETMAYRKPGGAREGVSIKWLETTG